MSIGGIIMMVMDYISCIGNAVVNSLTQSTFWHSGDGGDDDDVSSSKKLRRFVVGKTPPIFTLCLNKE